MKELLIQNDVLIGKDGWLFLFNGNNYQFDFLLGKKVPSQESINSFKENLNRRYYYCNKHNITYLHVVFPSKPVCMSEYLPDKYKKVSSLYEKYFLPKETEGKYALYPLQELLQENSKETPVFLEEDTHNSYKGYLVIINGILNKFNIATRVEHKKMKKHYLTGLKSRLITPDRAKKQTQKDFIVQSPNIVICDNIKYLSGNTNNIVISYNQDAFLQKRLLIFGDSFIKDCLGMLSEYFSDIMYVRSKFFHQDIVENYVPDIVISSNAERYLPFCESDQNANNFMLELYGKKDYSVSREFFDALYANMSYRYYPQFYKKWSSSKNADHIKKLVQDLYSFNSFKQKNDIRISKGAIAVFFTYCFHINIYKDYGKKDFELQKKLFEKLQTNTEERLFFHLNEIKSNKNILSQKELLALSTNYLDFIISLITNKASFNFPLTNNQQTIARLVHLLREEIAREMGL